MAVGPEQLKADMEKVMVANPLMHLATISLDGVRPHSSTVWFAPDDELRKLFWLSSPLRTHSRHIDTHTELGKLAPVSGSMNVPVRPSMPVLGLSFEGVGRRARPNEIESAVGLLLVKAVFTPDEIEKYLNPAEGSTMPTHAVYAAEVEEWTDFDGMRSPEDRKSVLAWPPTASE